jgi:hypothetical protein
MSPRRGLATTTPAPTRERVATTDATARREAAMTARATRERDDGARATTDEGGARATTDEDRARLTKYWLRRRCSTGSHASEATEVGMLTGGESSNESHQATGRRARRGGSASASTPPGAGRRAERGGIDTPGHFAFATPMSARVCEEGMTTPRTPTLANDSPDRARLDELLAAPVKPNFGTRAAIECTPRHTPLKLRFDDNVDVVVSGTHATSKKRARGKLSDVFKATKSTTPRLTRARKAML